MLTFQPHKILHSTRYKLPIKNTMVMYNYLIISRVKEHIGENISHTHLTMFTKRGGKIFRSFIIILKLSHLMFFRIFTVNINEHGI